MLDDIMYVVCHCSSTILLYNKDTFRPLDLVIEVDGMRHPCDIVVSDRQLYIADSNYSTPHCIWRVSVDDHSYVKWLSTESTTHTHHDTMLSATSQRLLVTSQYTPSLRQFHTSDAQLLRVVELPGCVNTLYHGVETTRGTFVIGHEGTSHNERQTAVSELFRFCHVAYIGLLIIFMTIMHLTNSTNVFKNNKHLTLTS